MFYKLVLFLLLSLVIVSYVIVSDRFLKLQTGYFYPIDTFGTLQKNQSSTAFLVTNSTMKFQTEHFHMPWSVCSQWRYRVSSGMFSTGAPFIRVHDVCVQDTNIWFLFVSQEEAKGYHDCIAQCCYPSKLQKTHCNRLRIPYALCQNLHLYKMFISALNRTFDDLPSPLISGRTYLLDTAIEMRYQFGHSVSKFVQLYSLNEKFEHIMINRVDRLPGGFHYGFNETNLRNLFDLTVDRLNTSVILAKSNFVCVEELWWVPNYEQMFFSWSVAQQWRTLLNNQYGLRFPKCPPARALFLQRTEGMRRRVINADVIDQLAKELGITLERAYIGSHNTTFEHIQLFSSFGFLISTHSSALKALIFASPNAIVIEVVGRYIPEWRASPFQLGTEFLDIHYIVSKGHSANWSSCIGYCHPPEMDRDADLFVNITSLRSALHEAIASQRRICPLLRYS